MDVCLYVGVSVCVSMLSACGKDSAGLVEGNIRQRKHMSLNNLEQCNIEAFGFGSRVKVQAAHVSWGSGQSHIRLGLRLGLWVG